MAQSFQVAPELISSSSSSSSEYCAGQRFIAALSHTGGQARKN